MVFFLIVYFEFHFEIFAWRLYVQTVAELMKKAMSAEMSYFADR